MCIRDRANADRPHLTVVGRPFEGTQELAELQRELLAGAFDVVAIDVGFTEGEAFQSYVNSKDELTLDFVATCGAFGWSPVEGLAWIEALRKLEKKPTIVGIGVGSSTSMSQEALKLLEKLLPETQARSELVLYPLCTDGVHGRPRYYQLSENQRGVLRYGLGEVRDLLMDQRENEPLPNMEKEYARCQRLLDALQQYEEAMRFEIEAGDEDPRGRILATNVKNALKDRPAGTRALALVRQRDLARASDATSFVAKLAQMDGPTTTCLGVAVGSAVFRAYDPNDHEGGPLAPRDVVLTAETTTILERALRDASKTSAWFDLRDAPRDGLVAGWFAAPRALRSSGLTCGGPVETPWDHRVLGDFDALLWMPSVARAAATPEKASGH